MRLDIHYRTHFRYDNVVRDSHNEVRACPAHDDRQWVLGYRLEVWPTARVQSFADYWGTRVDFFGIREPHDELDVVAHATVQTQPVEPPEGGLLTGFLADPGRADRWFEYLHPTRHTAWSAAMRREAQGVVDGLGPAATTAEAVRAVHDHVHQRLAYRPGVTDIGTPVTRVWEEGAGVCQDYSHLTVAMLRSIGVPARYASGYLFTTDGASDAPEAVPSGPVGIQTHAWFEAAVGPGAWLPLDPTGGVEAGVRHVKIGHGRDYDDVAPFHGTYQGSAAAELSVEIEMAEIGALGRSMAPPVSSGLSQRQAEGRRPPQQQQQQQQ
jgi:transglutaminase-like putative cysteine protease